MKRCPHCGQIYTDDLLYCLQDGNELLPQYIETETPTVVRTPKTTSQRSGKPYLKYLAIALVALLALGIAGAAGAYFVWTKLSGETDRAVANPTPRPTPSATAQPAKSPPLQNKEPQTPPANAATPKPRASENTNGSAPDDDGPELVDPSTTRITFRRGRESETVTGYVTANRDFLLRTVSGQNLSARVTSERDCVTFPDGERAVGFVTPQGDSRLTLINNCQSLGRFRLSVTVR